MLVTPAEIIVDLLERTDEVHDDDENHDDDEDDDDDDDDDDNDDDDNDDDDDDEDDEDDEDDDNDDDDVFIAIWAPGEAFPPPRPSGWTLFAPLDRLQGKLVTHLDRRGGRLSPPLNHRLQEGVVDGSVVRMDAPGGESESCSQLQSYGWTLVAPNVGCSDGRLSPPPWLTGDASH